MSTIAKSGSVSHGKALAEYAEKKTIDEKEVSTEIGRNGVWGLDAAEVIKEMAEDDFGTDDRNQASHDTAKAIVETGVLDDAYLPYV